MTTPEPRLWYKKTLLGHLVLMIDYYDPDGSGGYMKVSRPVREAELIKLIKSTKFKMAPKR
jgi:hypothetical protein